MENDRARPKARPCENSIFQTSQARPTGTKVQLLLVLITFVACLFVAMILAEETPSQLQVVATTRLRANQNSQ